MCTVTFTPRESGYALAMNRDEQRSRVIGLPVRRYESDKRHALGPSEPGGGTWINLNDQGTTLALINWYSIKAALGNGTVSRGSIIQSMRWLNTPKEIQVGLEQQSLKNTKAFRLIGVFPHERQLHEWQWNTNVLKHVEHPWQTGIWISSGYDEPGAELRRRATFEHANKQGNADSIQWLRKLHRSHRPGCGPYSICMHRQDAVTVSYTEVEMDKTKATMRHLAESPCKSKVSGDLKEASLTIKGVGHAACHQAHVPNPTT